MSDESLTNEEVASLLESHSPSHNNNPNSERFTPHLPNDEPPPADQQLLQSLRTLHLGVAERFGNVLETRVRANVNVRISDVAAVTFQKLSVSLGNPTCLSLVRANPLDDQLLIDASPHILFPMIDRLLGGRVEPGPIPDRPLTEIEQRLASRIISWLLEELVRGWQAITTLELSLDRLEHNPLILQTLFSNETALVVCLEVKMLSASGKIGIAIPQRCLDSVKDLLLRQSSDSGPASNGQSDEDVAEVVATLAESAITMPDLVGLRVGDIITTEKKADEPIQVTVDGATQYDAAIGTSEGRKAVRIMRPQ